MAKNDSISSVMVVPSWGDHPDDPREALKPGYWPHPNLAKDANFVIHRQSNGEVVVTETGTAVKDGGALVVVLGRGQRRLDGAEVAAFDDMIAGLRREKRISGRLKRNVNGDLRFEDADQAEPDLPPNRDTTPPEVVVEAEPDPEPEPEEEEEDTRRPSKP